MAETGDYALILHAPSVHAGGGADFAAQLPMQPTAAFIAEVMR